MRSRSALVLIIAAAFGTCGAADVSEKKLSDALATKLLEEWQQERSRLVSGFAVVNVTGLDFHPQTKQRVESEAEFATAFDWKNVNKPVDAQRFQAEDLTNFLGDVAG